MNTAPPPRSLNTLNQQQQQQYQIMVPIGPPPPLPLNLPCGQLIEGNREDYISIGVPLLKALIKGDWKAAKPILDEKPELVRFAITKNYDTPLHIAASAEIPKHAEEFEENERPKHAKEFVENLLKLMETKDLELQNKSYNTAFSLAAMAGNVEIATIMVEKNKAVLEIAGSQGMMPLSLAASCARDDMVNYLYDNSNKMSGDFWTNEKRGWVLQKCVEADLYHVAVKIVNDCTQLTSGKTLLRDVILVLAQKTEAFKEREPSSRRIIKSTQLRRIIKSIFALYGVKLGQAGRESDALKFLQLIWNKIAIMPNDEIDDILQGPPVEIEEDQHKKMTYPSRVLFVAAELGNLRFITELLQSCPDLIWTVDDKGLSIFHVAVKHRRANVYGLLYEIGSMKELITTIEDENGNNMLHLLAESAQPKQSDQKLPAGSALQMQRELLWFQEVEQMIPPAYRQRKNKHGETPQDLFTKSHEKLVAQGEKWIKETAPQGMLVAALVATIAFAAAFTLPGGYNQNTGLPMFRQKAALIVFVMADALSLLSSSASILLLLSLFTEGYAEQDFKEFVPKRLMLGLGTLVISIMTMMIAFSASFFLLYYKNLNWLPISITLLAIIVVDILALIHTKLQYDVVMSTKGSTYFFNPRKPMLYG